MILVSGAIMAGSQNIAMFLVFRFFAGAGAFMILAAVPIWMAEVAPPYLRGALVQLHAVILVIGYMAASYLGYGIYHWKDGGSTTWVSSQCPTLPWIVISHRLLLSLSFANCWLEDSLRRSMLLASCFAVRAVLGSRKS